MVRLSSAVPKKPKERKAPKPPKVTLWKEVAAELYPKAAAQGMHFSAKLTHSNSAAAGVRLSAEAKAGLPYVAVSEIDGVPLDYIKMDTRLSGAWTNLRRVQVGDAAEAPGEQVESIKGALDSARRSAAEEGTQSVEERLRQVILQDVDGADFSVTPLQSAGLSEVIQRRLRDEDERAKAAGLKRFRTRGVLGLGGANPQNMGGLVRSTQRPLWFSAPQEDPAIRQALAIHYRGIEVRPSRVRVQAYIDWRAALMRAHAGAMPSNAQHRQKEVEFLSALADDLKLRGAAAREQLAKGAKAGLFEGDDSRLSTTVPADVAALIEPARRYAGWERDLARRLYQALLSMTVLVNGQRVLLPIGQAESVRWIGTLEECLS